MLTASPEWFTAGGKPGQFANEALEFVKKKFGAENILTASLHLDEKTPHLQVLLTPIVEKKVSANSGRRIISTAQRR